MPTYIIRTITLSVYIILSSVIFADAKENSFETITTRNGLSDNEIRSISDDGRGFLWLGTNEGLNRYDGYGVTVYNSNPFDSTALSGNRIWDIYKDFDGDIWAVTDKGLDLYVYGKDEFVRFQTASKPTYITQDNDGLLWVATLNTGLYTINKTTGEKNNHVFHPGDPYSLSSNNFDETQFRPIVVDTSGNVWIGTLDGLNYYRKDKDIFIRFRSSVSAQNTISDNTIKTLLVMNGDVWIGTHKGLDKIHIGDLSITRYAGSGWISILNSYSVNQLVSFKPGTPFKGFWIATTSGLVFYNEAFNMFADVEWYNLFGQYVKSIYEGVNGDIWIDVLAFKGLIRFSTENFFVMNGFAQDGDFEMVQPDPDKQLAISSGDITDFYVDGFNNVWAATKNGLNRLVKTQKSFESFDPKTSRIRGMNIRALQVAGDKSIWVGHEKGVDHLSGSLELIKSYDSDPTNINSLLTNETGLLSVAPNGEGVWVSSQYGGLTFVDLKTNKFKRFIKFIDSKTGEELAGRVNTIFHDKKDITWFATHEGVSKHRFENRGGKKFDLFEVYKLASNPNKGFLSNVTSILRDSKNEIWVGTQSNGLFRINSDEMEELAHYIFDKKDLKSFSSNAVKTIYEDRDGNIWIGSAGEGLYRYNRDRDNFDRFSVKDGLSSNTVVSIISDKTGDIWLGTRKGLVKMVVKDKTFQTYSGSDGLPSDIFNDRAIGIDADGGLFFGSVSGLAKIDPQNIVINNKAPNLAISSIQSIDYDGNISPVDFSSGKIEIGPTIQTINIEFVGISFNKSLKNQYQYTLDKYLNNWVMNKNSRTATFQGLDVGEYTFKFKASNNDGVWNEIPHTLSMQVKPPFWKTWYAYTGYVFAFIGLGFSGFFGMDKYRRKTLDEDRKDKELSDAREFQLRMVAKEIPDFEGVDIKAFMRTSTEVGGDYYDFFELEDGSFYAVCGDATGHGSQSGMMVSITKAGLASLDLKSPDKILNKLNRVVRRIDTGRLRMSLSVCIFRENRVHISSAAMPPAYLYSSRKGKVEEIQICNLPLGGLANETFNEEVRPFTPGDVLVLLSDGLPEAPNSAGNLLDYPAVKACIEQGAHKGASHVKQSLVALADDWLKGNQNPDDITFIVFEKNPNVHKKKKKEVQIPQATA